MTAFSRPTPIPDPDTKPFWEGCRQGRLFIPQCQDCGHYIFFPAPNCNQCGSSRLEWRAVRGRGNIYSWVVVHHPIHPAFSQVPYIVAVVELEEEPGLRIPGNLLGCSPKEVRGAMAVEVVFEPLTPEIALPQWRPVAQEVNL